jgi:hypothetical protein
MRRLPQRRRLAPVLLGRLASPWCKGVLIVGHRTMKIAAAVVLAAVLPLASSTQAQTFTEADVMRQSKFCENAARLPWGDVQNNKWGDCHPGLSREMARKMLLAFGA